MTLALGFWILGVASWALALGLWAFEPGSGGPALLRGARPNHRWVGYGPGLDARRPLLLDRDPRNHLDPRGVGARG